MSRAPFDDLRMALAGAGEPDAEYEGVRPDLHRSTRTGLPEIVYCHGKSVAAISAACSVLTGAGAFVIATRCPRDVYDQVADLLSREALTTEYHGDSQTMMVTGPETVTPEIGGRVGILTAGTSDWAMASLAEIVARASGCEVIAFRDVGVAGLHRLVKPLELLVSKEVDAIIVAAGMDGVLPTVVAGLTDIPVIGLPTSTGYGHGGLGEGALTTMLQSCAPGVAVVNIDNGVGAGAFAALIARRVYRLRRQSQSGEGGL
jgi:pyridinium-3,5-biscarboxylic acid mononucleotide synthase